MTLTSSVAALVERFGLGRLCDLAREKDSGFSALVLVDMLSSFRRFAPGDFGLSADAVREPRLIG